MVVSSKPSRYTWTVCLALALVTLGCFWPMTRHEFVGFDDPQYILDNPHVNSGLSWGNVIWALTGSYSCNWHPLTWLSHMLDCQLYGLAPGGHHFSSLLLHILNTLLLFLLLKEMTGAFWRSACVAALFAWHPLHVESVAWAAERKDVLSTLFFLLTLLAYVTYVKQAETKSREPIDPRQKSGTTFHVSRFTFHTARLTDPATRYYALTLLLFALGLMCKPMLVTLPFVLLLLDFWPLRRFELKTENLKFKTLLSFSLEKLPFYLLSLGSSIITFLAQRTGGAVMSFEAQPFPARLANACVAYWRYLCKTFWPFDLAVIYPVQAHLPLAWVGGALLVLAGLSVLFLSRARREPYLLVGWLWFLGTLVPTIGLVQVGGQAMADRYMYIPGIGLFVLLVWGAHGLCGAGVRPRILLVLTEAGALAGCLVCTSAQLQHWQNSETLFRHAVAVTGGGFVAFDHLGTACLEKGKLDEAAFYLGQAARLEPNDAEAHYNLGTALLRQSRMEEAAAQFEQALRLQPIYTAAHSNLALALRGQGKLAECAAQFREAARLSPRDPGAHFNLGVALLELERPAEAADCFTQTLRLNPQTPTAHFHLAIALARLQRPDEAMLHAQLARDMAAGLGQDTTANQAAELLKQFSVR